MHEREVYRQRARECVKLADQASSTHRKILLEIARTWWVLWDEGGESVPDQAAVH
jgi:hypothetical protein